MEGLHEVAGESGTISQDGANSLEIGGKTYHLKTKTLREYMEREVYILKHTSPLKLLGEIPPSIRGEDLARIENKIVQNAGSTPRFVSLLDDSMFDNSVHGIAYELWRALRDDYPEIKNVQDALSLIDVAGGDHLIEIRTALFERGESSLMGKSDGRSRKESGKTTDVVAAVSAGPESSEVSQKLTDSNPLTSFR